MVSVERRFARSRALGRAVARGDPAATRAALAPLLKAQVRRLVVVRGSHVLARVGHTRRARAGHAARSATPAGGRSAATRSSVAGDAGIAGIIRTLTGAGVSMTAAGRPAVRLAGGRTPAAVRSFAGTAFPRGALRVRLALPAPAGGDLRADGRPDARPDDRRRGRAALPGRGVRARDAAASCATSPATPASCAPSRRADPRALRAEIVHLFRDRTLHVVRIRAVTAGGRLVDDVGGPYVLAPASAPLRLGGRVIGRVTLSIQDDTGFVKLMHRFTGAVVELRTPPGRVPGGNVPAAGPRLLAHGLRRPGVPRRPAADHRAGRPARVSGRASRFSHDAPGGRRVGRRPCSASPPP